MSTSRNLKLTKTAIADLEAPTDRDRYFVYDSSFPGFCVMVTKTGKKSFYLNRNIDGRSRRLRIGDTKSITVEQARKKAVMLAAQVELGEDPTQAKRDRRKEKTLDDLMKDYLVRHAKPNKKTWDQDQDLYRRRLSHWGKRKLSSITPGEIDKYHKKLGEEVGIHTANAVVTLLKTMYNKAKKWRLFKGENPTGETTLYRTKGRERWITPEEMPHFMACLDQYPCTDFRDYVLVSLYTGARQANVIAMRWEDLSLEELVWTIPETKNGESLTVDLVEETRPLLARRRLRQDPDEEWVFPDDTKPTGHMVRPWFHWRKFLKAAGIENLRMHDLRHTHASWLIETGADISDVQAALGHKKIETSLRYAHRKRGRTRAKRGAAVGGMLDAAKPPADPNPIVPLAEAGSG
ncbi:MAG: site-specific integrase [bacterium]|nr:site-specific integrase [bacterium]